MQNKIEKILIVLVIIIFSNNSLASDLKKPELPFEIQQEIFTNIDGYNSMKDVLKNLLKLRVINKRLNQNFTQLVKKAAQKYISKNLNNKNKLYKEIIDAVVKDENISDLIVSAFILGGIKGQELYDLQDDIGDPLLIIATFNGNDALVDTLLNMGKIDPNIPGRYNASALLIASSLGYLPIVNSLLKAGANVNIKNSLGKTALILAVEGNHIDTVKALLQAGADLNTKDVMGYSALSYAQKSEIKKLLRGYREKQSSKNR